MSCVQDQGAVAVSALPISPRIRAALALLMEAHEYARDAACEVWDFAVEIQELRTIGLCRSDFRWLSCKGYVEHAREITRRREESRTFRQGRRLRFTSRTCFVLTQAGLELARGVCDESRPDLLLQAVDPGCNGNGHTESRVPQWNGCLHELWFAEKLIKRYRLPAPNQETILSAFQEEGWPPRIDDPLRPHPEQDAKRRLHDTIKSLNRHQHSPLLHFLGDGTGTGVRWKPLERTRPAKAR